MPFAGEGAGNHAGIIGLAEHVCGGGPASGGRRPDAAGGVAVTGALDPDHARAVVGEELGSEGAASALRQSEDGELR